MDTRFLESLLAVAETGSIAAAARQQGLTAAAISQRIRVLEVEFGTELLNRSAHAATPTEACLRLLPAASRLVRDAGRLAGHIDPEGLGGPFRLGAISTALLDHAPAVIRAFRRHAPKAVLTVRPGTSESLYDELLAGNLDAAITVAAPFALPREVRSETLALQPVVHVVPKGAFEAPGDAEALPWIVYDRASWGGRGIWEEHGRWMSAGHILCELDALETIAVMVSQGSGQAVLPLWHGLEKDEAGFSVRRLDPVVNRRVVFLQQRTGAAKALARLALSALLPEAGVSP
ncbi:LysR family transcriptional regulator [Roseibium sp. Sym1]|uniref:LysR family transcriptional regulator n=1 Tax=Roseibium sp. Sym1 TaxID=3016006 RepID=UPI0022B56504|nr:LysR family transcriptional regulator [Roseibium sp. Sym1]